MKKNNPTTILARALLAIGLSTVVATSAMADNLQEQRAAAENGTAKQKNVIGGMYYKGTHGAPVNAIEAARWFSKSAKEKDLQGTYSLATQYHFGDGVLINYGKAIELYTYAAEHGHPHAAYNLGTIYYNGFGVEKDIPLAKQLYTQACDNGSLQACEVRLSFID